MPGFLVHVGASITCAHGGPVTIIPAGARVLVSGQPVATVADQFLVAGCAFNVAGKPSPCVRLQWLLPAARILVEGRPAILLTSAGLGLSPEQAPQGPPIIAATQPRVSGI